MAAWRDSAQPERDPARALPFTSAEVEALVAQLATVSSSGWEDMAKQIAQAKSTWSPDLLENVIAWLAEHEDLVSQAQAVADRGMDRQVHETPRVPFDALGLTRLLAFAAEARAAASRADEAAELLADALDIGDALGTVSRVGSLISRSASYETALYTMHRLLSHHQLLPEDLNRLSELLADTQQRPVFAAAVAREAEFGVEVFDRMRNTGWGSALRPLVNMSESHYMSDMASLAGAAGQPYYECATRVAELREESRNPFTRFISRNVVRDGPPWIITALQGQARTEARIDLARIAIAIEREYMATGAYPATLADITDDFRGELPVDPFIGQPFRYRLESYGFVLYSVGANLTDDGGTEDGPDVTWWGFVASDH